MNGYEFQELKPYKGYGISKAYELDFDGERIKDSLVYVVDDGEDYIGEEYKTLKEARQFIDTILKGANK